MPKFQPGQSGNPGGRPKGARSRLQERFLRDLEQHWREHGEAALMAAATKAPEAYCAMVAKLLPKEHILDVGETLADALVRLSARHGDPALPGEPDGLREGGVAGHA